jgi:hypothetical protein
MRILKKLIYQKYYVANVTRIKIKYLKKNFTIVVHVILIYAHYVEIFTIKIIILSNMKIKIIFVKSIMILMQNIARSVK